MRPGNLLLAMTAIIFCLWVGIAAWGAPSAINHQGYLTNSTGMPVNSTVGITFSIYSSNPARNNPVWRETQLSVAVSRGIYSATLGSVVPITAPFDVQYFLGIKVGSDPEMTPLQALTSVPYALRAKMAETVTGSSINTAAIADNSVTTAKIANGAVTDAKISGPINDDKLSANISRLNTAETVTGAKIFTTPIVSTVATGAAPLQVASTTVIPNLNAEMVEGKNLADLDSRYPGARTLQPTLQQIATMRWDQVSQPREVTVATPGGMTFDGAHIWVVSYESDKVTQIRAIDGSIVRTIDLPAGSAPYAAAFDGQNVWVTNSGANNVSRINVATGTKQEFVVGNTPIGIAFDGANIFVVISGSNSVVKLDTNGAIVPGGTYGVVASPWAIVFDGSAMWVTSSSTEFISKIGANGSVTNLPAFSARSAVFDGTHIWTATTERTIERIAITDNSRVSTMTITPPYSILFDGVNIWYTVVGGGVYKMRTDMTQAGNYLTSAQMDSLAFDGVNIWAAIPAENNVVKIPQTALTTPVLTVTDTSIEENAVTTSKIADRAVTTAKIANDAVTTWQIADGTIMSADIGNNAVTSAKIQGSAVGMAALSMPHGYAATIAQLGSGPNIVYPVTAFTPPATGTCLVIANAQVKSNATNPSEGPSFSIIYNNGTDNLYGDAAIFPAFSSGIWSAALSRSGMINVSSGTSHKFGCYFDTTDFSWISDTVYCNINYLCF